MLVGTLHGSHHHQCINVHMNYCKLLWTKASAKCPKCKCNSKKLTVEKDSPAPHSHNLPTRQKTEDKLKLL